MIIKIKRQECLELFPIFPTRIWNSKLEQYDAYFADNFGAYVFSVLSKSYRGHIKCLAAEITNLTKALNSDSLIFLCDLAIPWLKRDSDFKQAKEALQYLSDNKIGKNFNGGLKVDLTQLPTFIMNLCWLVRTNTILPYAYFIDPEQTFFANICQYGNLHFSTMTSDADKMIKKEISKTKLEFLRGICDDKYPQRPLIERQA